MYLLYMPMYLYVPCIAVVVIDSSDANWWKGSSPKGEGLFPANFVTSELCTPEPKRSVQFNEAVQVNTLPAYEEEESEPEIDEDKIDRYIT
jgi:signal transducing adaptor molecule